MTGAPVLDASALLCVLFDEPGQDVVAPLLAKALIGSVNYSEVVARVVEKGMDPDRAIDIIGRMDLNIIPFDAPQAEAAGRLRATTRGAGLSLGDRACLALALATGGSAVTCDKAWARLTGDVGVQIEFVR